MIGLRDCGSFHLENSADRGMQRPSELFGMRMQ